MRQNSWFTIMALRLAIFIFVMLYLGIRGLPIHLSVHYHTPDVVLMLILTLAVHRPALMPPAMAFILGIAQDIISFAPLGLSALTAMIGCAIIATYRRPILANNFIQQWIWVCGIIVILSLLQIALKVIFFLPRISVQDWFILLALNAAIYPVLCLCIASCNIVLSALIGIAPNPFHKGKP